MPSDVSDRRRTTPPRPPDWQLTAYPEADRDLGGLDPDDWVPGQGDASEPFNARDGNGAECRPEAQYSAGAERQERDESALRRGNPASTGSAAAVEDPVIL